MISTRLIRRTTKTMLGNKFRAQAIDDLEEEVLGSEDENQMELEEEVEGQFYRPGQNESAVVVRKAVSKNSGDKEVDQSAELIAKLMKNSSGKLKAEAEELVHKLKKSKFDEIE
jgi:hypothetical protein